MENPLVTIVVLAYQQEQYIREAVEGAFAQNYHPLEIILSDDCSDDQTFEIMKKMAEDYDGPHKVVLNRCRQNSGFAMHINQTMVMSSGELIVIAAGDDISQANRVSALTQAWIDSGKKSGSIYSGYLTIDQYGVEGDIREPKFRTSDSSYLIENPESIWNDGVFGCTHAWTRDVFEVFGDLMPNVIYEDRVIPFRSALLGNVSFVTEPLIKYRVLPESLCRFTFSGSRRDKIAKFVSYYRKRQDALINNQRDLETALKKNLVNENDFEIVQKVLENEIRRSNIYQRLLESRFLTRLGIAAKSGSPFSVAQRLKFWIVAFAPWIYGRRTSKLVSKVKSLVRR